ncbi:MAG: Nif3-like dinuclear metal center hexameric protein [Burkholderiaceae bacterium]|jgi:dinuclear metal center YbgI/SA1388 family protein|nr:Nif3-like dinuclear metal center hexameric protein [Burkholderiaceae bacterium]
MVRRDDLASFLDQTLNVAAIRDYCPNGLQVEGKSDIHCIVTGVTASLALINAAIASDADALLVHHGLFWRDEDPCIVGPRRERIRRLLKHDLNLFAYHLPLDLHEQMGNNAMLGEKLGLQVQGRFGENHLGWLGTSGPVNTVGGLANLVEERLGRKPLVIGDTAQAIATVAWCSGAAQGMLPLAARAGAHAYLSGEIAERTVHEAREYEVAYLSCGHHATERYGIEALGNWLSRCFALEHRFIEIDNPV